jgi:Xaa-Pro dipeptidase
VTGNDEAFSRLTARLPAIQSALREQGLDGWLLYDFRARNAIAAALLARGELTRRFFVYVPAAGEPVAVVHGMETAPWSRLPWSLRAYTTWRELGDALGAVLPAGARVALEYSPHDAVPALDLVPGGVLELVRAQGVEPVSSGDLVTLFHSRWSDDDVAAHRRTAAVLADVAAAAFAWLAERVYAGEAVHEAGMREHVLRELAARGAGVGADCIAATGMNAADPHYSPAGEGATFRRGDVVLLDLWSKESEQTVYADQTWMACLVGNVPPRAAELFGIVCAARDAAVEFLHNEWAAGRPVAGGAVDDVARAVINDRGYGSYFVHRTGHSIDRATHGAGPNIDNHETQEQRLLVPGIGFSIEPGIYIAGELGVRTEINVYYGEGGPEVTTPRVQSAMLALAE